MKKIRLELDTLNVSSFSTQKPMRGQGTVQGHDSAYPCTVYDTCQPTGNDTGGGSGFYTCGNAATCGLCLTDLDNCDTAYKHCGV